MRKSYSRPKRIDTDLEGVKMNREILRQKCEEYPKIEGRAKFYDVAVEIVDTHPLQASIIILAVWNVGRFRFYASDSQTLINLKEAIKKCKPLFDRLRGKDFRTVDFNEIQDIVKQIYATLSKVEIVKYTGASKIMHLFNRDLFLMWDKDMRKEYGYNIANEDEYLDYLKQMQEEFKDIEWDMPNKTLPKAIDEYNFVTITYPRMQERKRRRIQKRKRKRTEYAL